jgi:hypothetical protein
LDRAVPGTLRSTGATFRHLGEVAMDIERTPVDVRFSCRDCGRRWWQSYDVVRWTEYGGYVTEAYFRGLVPVPPPALGQRCDACGSTRVDWAQALFVPHRTTRRAPAVGRPRVSARWSEIDEPPHAIPGFFTRARHQRQPLTRRFP